MAPLWPKWAEEHLLCFPHRGVTSQMLNGLKNIKCEQLWKSNITSISYLWYGHHHNIKKLCPQGIFKSRDITLPTKVCLVKAMVFPVVMYGFESWTVKTAECQRIDASELWCWRRLLSVPWTARRSNQSILKESIWLDWYDLYKITIIKSSIPETDYNLFSREETKLDSKITIHTWATCQGME